MKKICSVILSIVILSALFIPSISSLAKEASETKKDNGSTTTRYSVLVIDVSSEVTFSVSGETIFTADPATPYTKEAAKHFIRDLINASGTNYCAIIAYSAEPEIVSGFSNDFDFLESKISMLATVDGKPDIAEALEEANYLLDTIEDADAIKNCVLITTGNTAGGDYLENGHYDSSVIGSNWVYSPTGINIYMYANAAYEASLPIKDKANLYVIGLFQTVANMPSSGSEIVALFRLIAADLASSSEYYYDVTNLDDLVFYFGEIADNITSDSLNHLFINQHFTYQNSEVFDKDVSCGLGYRFANVMVDVSKDKSANGYSFCKTLSKVLGLEFDDIIESDVDTYELVLAKILCGETAQKKQQNDILIQYTSALFDGLELSLDIKDRMESTVVPSQTEEIRNLLSSLATYDAGSAEYCDALDGILRSADALGAPQFIDSLKDELLVGIAFEAADAMLDTVSDIIQYRACYEAFCNATDEFISVLQYSFVWFYENTLNDSGMPDIGYLSDIMSEVYSWDTSAIINSFNVVCFREAIITIISNVKECKNDPGNVMVMFNHIMSIIEEHAGAFTTDVIDTCGMFIIDKIIDCIPVIGKIKLVYDVGRLLLDAGLFIDETITSNDERALCIDLIRKSHMIAAMFSDICHNEIGKIQEDDISDENFKEVMLFDAAVNAYESTLSFAASYAIKYEEYLFEKENAGKANQNKLSKYAANILALRTIMDDCNSPWCHTKGLLYDTDTGSMVYNDGNLVIVIIACPVEVVVSDSTGNFIADISSTELHVLNGYENYFYSITDATGDCSKVAIIPSAFKVTLSGENNGTMDVYLAKLNGYETEGAIAFRSIPVDRYTFGELIHSQSNEGLFDLDINGTILIGSDADEHTHTYGDPAFIWEKDFSRCSMTICCTTCGFSDTIPCEISVSTVFDQACGILTITYTASVNYEDQVYTDQKSSKEEMTPDNPDPSAKPALTPEATYTPKDVAAYSSTQPPVTASPVDQASVLAEPPAEEAELDNNDTSILPNTYVLIGGCVFFVLIIVIIILAIRLKKGVKEK
ncbi:MAG: VWA domain-containing protein [Clostridia bacterium]|nr:VWA domain-containing protein [Clostridia bacterium]